MQDKFIFETTANYKYESDGFFENKPSRVSSVEAAGLWIPMHATARELREYPANYAESLTKFANVINNSKNISCFIIPNL